MAIGGHLHGHRAAPTRFLVKTDGGLEAKALFRHAVSEHTGAVEANAPVECSASQPQIAAGDAAVNREWPFHPEERRRLVAKRLEIGKINCGASEGIEGSNFGPRNVHEFSEQCCPGQ